MGNKKNIIYLILGLGLGIIITNIVHSAYPKKEFVELSDDTITEKARELGMVPLKENIIIDKSNEDSRDKELEEISKKLEEALIRLEKSEEVETERLEEEIVIESGWNLTKVAEQLYLMDLIDDQDEFTKFVIGENLSRKIITGKYKIKYGSSYLEIINILTDKDHITK